MHGLGIGAKSFCNRHVTCSRSTNVANKQIHRLSKGNIRQTRGQNWSDGWPSMQWGLCLQHVVLHHAYNLHSHKSNCNGCERLLDIYTSLPFPSRQKRKTVWSCTERPKWNLSNVAAQRLILPPVAEQFPIIDAIDFCQTAPHGENCAKGKPRLQRFLAGNTRFWRVVCVANMSARGCDIFQVACDNCCTIRNELFFKMTI